MDINTVDQLKLFIQQYDAAFMFEDEVEDIDNITEEEFLYLKLKEII